MRQILVRVKPGHNLYEEGGNRFPGQTFLLSEDRLASVADAVERVKGPKVRTTAIQPPEGTGMPDPEEGAPAEARQVEKPAKEINQEEINQEEKVTPRLSIVISTRGRTALFQRSLAALCWGQGFRPKRAELVVVSDDPRGGPLEELRKMLGHFAGYFYRVRVLEVDSSRSVIPIFHNCPALWVNVGVKAAENDAVFKTDPECLPLTPTVMASLRLFRPDHLRFANLRMLTEEETREFSLEGLREAPPLSLYSKLAELPDLWYISAQQKRPYWFGALFSREAFIRVGGVDEEFLRGFAGEDDDWAERVERAGTRWAFGDELRILHQYHGEANLKHHRSPRHWANIRRLERSRAEGRIEANVGHDWGSRDVVVKEWDVASN